MVIVEKQDWGYLIDEKVLFGATVPSEEYLNLWMDLGEAIHYTKRPYSMIDYPGEYDINGVLVMCILGKWNKLSYLLTLDGEKVGLIQTDDVLNDDNVRNLDYWLYAEEKIALMIDQMELEGEKILLEK